MEAYSATRDRAWLDDAVMCFNWFLGHNDLNLPLYDPKTDGCRDGLMADGIDQNEGAESSPGLAAFVDDAAEVLCRRNPEAAAVAEERRVTIRAAMRIAMLSPVLGTAPPL